MNRARFSSALGFEVVVFASRTQGQSIARFKVSVGSIQSTNQDLYVNGRIKTLRLSTFIIKGIISSCSVLFFLV